MRQPSSGISRDSFTALCLLPLFLIPTFLILPFLVVESADVLSLSPGSLSLLFATSYLIGALSLYVRHELSARYFLIVIVHINVLGYLLLFISMKIVSAILFVIALVILRCVMINLSYFNRTINIATNKEQEVLRTGSRANIISNIISAIIPSAGAWALSYYPFPILVLIALTCVSTAAFSVDMLLLRDSGYFQTILPQPDRLSLPNLSRNTSIYVLTLLTGSVFVLMYSYIPLLIKQTYADYTFWISIYFSIQSGIVITSSSFLTGKLSRLKMPPFFVVRLASLLALLSIALLVIYPTRFLIVLSALLLGLSEIMFLPFLFAAIKALRQDSFLMKNIVFLNLGVCGFLGIYLGALFIDMTLLWQIGLIIFWGFIVFILRAK